MQRGYGIGLETIMGVITAIAIVIVAVSVIYPESRIEGDISESIYTENINQMKAVGVDYFRGDNLPKKIGETKRVYLSDMIDGASISNIKDENGKRCNEDTSYVEVTKISNNEHSMFVYLNCGGKTDYITATIYDNENNKINSESNTNNNASNLNNNYNNNYDKNYENINYLIYFDSNGGSNVKDQIIKHGQTAEYVTSTRKGYVFLGWYLDGKLYDFNKPVTKTITLSAKWSKVEVERFVVNFNSNGGSSVNSQIVYDGDVAYKPIEPTKKCYDFVGWYSNNTLTKKYNFNNEVTKDITLYAKWKENNECVSTYYVNFDSNGGTRVLTQEVKEGKKVEKPENPVRSGYIFNGWYLDDIKFNFNTKIYEDITLEAKWTKEYNTYNTIKFDSNGGTRVLTQEVKEGQKVEKPANPTRKGYIFNGWYLVGKKFNFNTRIYEDITLEAKWTKEYNTYNTVKFDSNGGSSVGEQYMIDGEKVSIPDEPIRKGYKFIGWYYNGVEFDFDIKVYNDITLQAKWELLSSTYCVKSKERIYSTGYAGKIDIDGLNSFNYYYTLEFGKDNISNLKVVDYGNISTTREYRNAYNYLVGEEKPIKMVNATGGNIDPLNYTNLMKYSFTKYNMEPKVIYSHSKGNNHYFNVNINLFNLSNIVTTPRFYTSEDYWVYFVPLYFDVEYADLTNCKTVSYTNEYKYKNNSNYIFVGTNY